MTGIFHFSYFPNRFDGWLGGCLAECFNVDRSFVFLGNLVLHLMFPPLHIVLSVVSTEGRSCG